MASKIFLEITTKDLSDTMILINLKGELVARTSEEFEKVINEIMREKKYLHIYSLKDLTYISSAGIGALISVLHVLEGLDGKISLVNIKPEIKEILDIAGVSQLFNILPDQEF